MPHIMCYLHFGSGVGKPSQGLSLYSEVRLLVCKGSCSRADGVSYIVGFDYCKVASFNTSCLETHAGLFRLLLSKVFDPYAP